METIRMLRTAVILTLALPAVAAAAEMPLAGAPYGSLSVCDALAKGSLGGVLYTDAGTPTAYVDRVSISGLEWTCKFGPVSKTGAGFRTTALCSSEGVSRTEVINISEDATGGTVTAIIAGGAKIVASRCSLPRSERVLRERKP